MTPLVVLARHHHGGGRPPASAFGFREDILVRDYLRVAEDALIEHGYRVLIVSGVSYAAGWEVASHQGAAVFVACHVNSVRAGQPRHYGMAAHRYDDDAGKVLGEHVVKALQSWAAPLHVRAQVCRPTDEDGDKHWTSGMYHVQRGAPCASVTYEPYFIDAIEAAEFREDPRRVGRALADGVASYLQR